MPWYRLQKCALNPVKSVKPNVTSRILVNMPLLYACGDSIIILLCFVCDLFLLPVMYILQELKVFYIRNLIQKPRSPLSLTFREKPKYS